MKNKLLSILKGSFVVVMTGLIMLGNVKLPSKAFADGERMNIKATDKKIIFDISTDGSGKANLISLEPYEYFGKTTLYFNENPNVVIEKEIQLGNPLEVEIDRFSADGSDKIYRKFLIVQGENVIIGDKYVTELPSVNETERTKTQTKKGLQIQNVDDAFKLGVQQCAINMVYAEVMYQIKPMNLNSAVVFETNGKSYYFRKEKVAEYDAMFKNLTDNNIEISMILIIQGGMMAVNNPTLVHPKFEGAEDIVSQSTGTVAAPNLTNEAGIESYTACMEFLASRYTRADKAYGFVSNIIVGNEVDAGGVWNNMGENTRADYVAQYERTLRLTDLAFKKYYKNINTMVSLTHAWNVYAIQIPTQYEKRHYKGKDIVDDINALAKSQGDFSWGIAYHPYPENLRDPRFWLSNDIVCGSNYNTTQKITYKNIGVLVNYLKTDDLLFNGSKRKIYLTEQGLNSFSAADSFAWPSDLGAYSVQKAQELQAVAYAYSYYLINFTDGIDAYILHRQIDGQFEGNPALSLGLWTCKTNTTSGSDPLEKKIVYDIFKYIDTEKSLEYTNPLLNLGYIKDSKGNVATSWSQLIPNFDETKLALRKDFIDLNGIKTDKIKNDVVLDDFEEETTDWLAAENTKSVKTTKAIGVNPKKAFSGEKCLKYQYSADSYENNGYAEKGIIKTFSAPLDITKYKSLNLAVNTPDGAPDGSKYLFTVILYSGFDVYTAQYELTPNDWQCLSIPLDKIEGLTNIDRIKLWFNTDSGTSFNSSLYVDNIGFTNKASAKKGCGNAALPLMGLIYVLACGFAIKRKG